MEGVVILGLLVGLFAIVPIAFVSAVNQPDAAWEAVGRNRGLTLLCIFFAGGVGALYYWLRIRPDLRAVARELPAPYRTRANYTWRE